MCIYMCVLCCVCVCVCVSVCVSLCEREKERQGAIVPSLSEVMVDVRQISQLSVSHQQELEIQK